MFFCILMQYLSVWFLRLISGKLVIEVTDAFLFLSHAAHAYCFLRPVPVAHLVTFQFERSGIRWRPCLCFRAAIFLQCQVVFVALVNTRPRLFKINRYPVCALQLIVIYAVCSVFHFLNKWSQNYRRHTWYLQFSCFRPQSILYS